MVRVRAVVEVLPWRIKGLKKGQLRILSPLQDARTVGGLGPSPSARDTKMVT